MTPDADGPLTTLQTHAKQLERLQDATDVIYAVTYVRRANGQFVVIECGAEPLDPAQCRQGHTRDAAECN